MGNEPDTSDNEVLNECHKAVVDENSPEARKIKCWLLGTAVEHTPAEKNT